jgi:hypothetical protein
MGLTAIQKLKDLNQSKSEQVRTIQIDADSRYIFLITYSASTLESAAISRIELLKQQLDDWIKGEEQFCFIGMAEGITIEVQRLKNESKND